MRGVFAKAAMLAVGVLLIVFSGCGGSGSRKSASLPTGKIKYLGAAHSIVSDRLPIGLSFSFVGQRYLFMGHHYLEVTVHFAEPARMKEGGRTWSQGPDEIEWGTQTGCDVRPFVIVYGLLKAPGDAAYLRIAGKLVEFKKASLPTSLHTTGALFYGFSSNPVSDLVIRTHTGQLIETGDPGVSLEVPEGVCGHTQRPSIAALQRRLPGLRHAVTQIAQCLRRHGFNVTNPNLTGPGPVFNTHDINTNSPRYIAAKAACAKEVLPALRAARGAVLHTGSSTASR